MTDPDPILDPRTEPPGAVPPGAETNETVTGVLTALQAEQVTASFNPGSEAATIRCTVCETESPVGEFEIISERRLEGTSDPDDMVIVVAARCPRCHISGAIVLGYGPDASDVDSDVVAALPR